MAAAPNLWRSDDAGLTWKVLPILATPAADTPIVNKAFILAVAKQNPEQVYLRAQTTAGDQLWRSDDGGAHWQTIFSTLGNLYGFAQSPDGSKIAVATVGGMGGMGGVWLSATKDKQFQLANAFAARCLSWDARGLYACADDSDSSLPLAFSSDDAATFSSIYNVHDLTVMQCPQTSRNGSLCPDKFPMLQVLLGIDDTSQVPTPVAAPPVKSGMCKTSRAADPQAWLLALGAGVGLLRVRAKLRGRPLQ